MLIPTKEPRIPPVNKRLPILISTAFLFKCPIVPDNEDPTI